MKLHEVEKIDELSLSDVAGEYGSAALKQVGNRLMGRPEGQLSVKEKMVQDAFFKDFVGQASSALNSAIKGGLVDPNKKSGTTQTQPAPNQTTQSTQTTQTTPQSVQNPSAKSTQPTKQNAQAQRSTIQNINDYIKKASTTINQTQDKNQKIALTKELVNFMADRKDYPEWSNALATVQQIIKKGNVDPNFANAAVQKLKAGQTIAEAYQIYAINKLLESVSLSWNDIGLKVLFESNKKYKIVESSFYKLNRLYESMLSEQEAQSIGEFMQDWFRKYMKNADYSRAQGKIDALIKSVEDGYPNIKQPLTTFANTAWALQNAQGKPAAATSPQAPQATAQPNTQTTTEPAQANEPATSSVNIPPKDQLVKTITTSMSQLKQIDVKAHQDLLKTLSGALPGASTPSSAPAAQPKSKPSKPAKVPYVSPAKAPVTAENKKVRR